MDYQKEAKLAKIYDEKFKINYDVNKKNLTDGDGKIAFKNTNYINSAGDFSFKDFEQMIFKNL